MDVVFFEVIMAILDDILIIVKCQLCNSFFFLSGRNSWERLREKFVLLHFFAAGAGPGGLAKKSDAGLSQLFPG